MSKFLHVLILLIFSQVPLNAANVNTVVLREWDNGKNIEYLEYTNNNRRGNLSTYTVKAVYGEIQEDNAQGNYDTTISKYIMNCTEKIYRLNKTYFLNGEEFVNYIKYDDNSNRDDPMNGWKKAGSSEVHSKVAGLLCE